VAATGAPEGSAVAAGALEAAATGAPAAEAGSATETDGRAAPAAMGGTGVKETATPQARAAAAEITAARGVRAETETPAVLVAAMVASRASRERTESALESDVIRWIYHGGEKHAATVNLVPGNSVYGEKLVKQDGEEYRLWDPFRSKLAGALKKGLKSLPIRNGTKVLYLGASTGTTVSHVSDIVGNSGIVFAVEPATRVARELIENVASKRKNVVPVLEDARRPSSYFSVFGKVDVVYCDIAQPDQTDIAIANCNAYLKPKGVMLLVVKARSIDVIMDPKAVVIQEAKKLEKAGFAIGQIINLEPFDKDHGMIYCIFKP
jgi:fibrillarin-like pre-rRNA processing protein